MKTDLSCPYCRLPLVVERDRHTQVKFWSAAFTITGLTIYTAGGAQWLPFNYHGFNSEAVAWGGVVTVVCAIVGGALGATLESIARMLRKRRGPSVSELAEQSERGQPARRQPALPSVG
jgi:hypothetical protein